MAQVPPARVHQGRPAVAVVSSGRTRAVKTALPGLPIAPGCYLFRDAEQAVLYVGKALALRQRLASYFSAARDGKTRTLMRHAHTLEWHTVYSEVEALILESQLIKRYQPPYNVQGREYPHYTFLRLNDGGGLPYLEVSASVQPDGAAYYGPFWSKRAAEGTLEFVNRLFRLRRCSGTLPSPAEGQGCFYAQARRCSAPCLGRVSASAYRGLIGSADELLRGDLGQLVSRLEHERDTAAEQLRFEQAAELHQMVVALRSLQSKRRHLRSAATTLNFLVVVRQRNGAAQVLAFSAARLRGQVSVSRSLSDDQRQALEQLLLAEYPIQRRLAIDLDELDQMHVVAEWLAHQGRQAVYLPLPDGPLSAKDAKQAVDAVAQTLAA